MAFWVMAFSVVALPRALRNMLLEKGLQYCASIAHQGTEQTFLNGRHVQRARPGILLADRL